MKENKHFEDIINAFSLKNKEDIFEIVKNNKYPLPTIYYVGMEKSGSMTLSNGFYNDDVAHWHGTDYFEYIYDTGILTNIGYDIYDLIEYIGEKYNFKPLVIESFREPISQ